MDIRAFLQSLAKKETQETAGKGGEERESQEVVETVETEAVETVGTETQPLNGLVDREMEKEAGKETNEKTEIETEIEKEREFQNLHTVVETKKTEKKVEAERTGVKASSEEKETEEQKEPEKPKEPKDKEKTTPVFKLEIPPFFNGTLRAGVEEAVFKLFNERIEDLVNRSVVEKIVLAERISLYEAIVKGDFLSENSLYQLVREVLWELKVPRVLFSESHSVVEVRGNSFYVVFPDGKEEEVFPTFSPIEAIETVKKGKVAIVLPISRVKVLKTLTGLKRKGKETKHPKIEEILQEALVLGASDIHIIPKERGFHTFFRVKKQLVEMQKFFMTKDQWKVFSDELRVRIADHTIGNFSVDDYRTVQEGRAEFPELNISIRYEYIPDGYSNRYGEIVIRILKKESVSGKVPLEERLKKFGYDEKTISLFKSILELEGGLVIISGKTNSGKSTLTANLLVSIPSERKVATAEDPIEYSYSSANVVQHQLYLPPEGERLDYEAYVKAFKRADTDVILIGEWRKQEGLTSAMVEQAQAGQLIFTTLHITSAFEVYKALWDIFGVPYAISASLILFSFNQSLFPKLCPYCSVEKEVSFSEQEVALLRQLTDREKEKLLSFRQVVRQRDKEKAKTCSFCGGTGYSGLIPIYEYFVPDEEIRNRLVSQKDEFTPLKLKEYLIESGASEKGLATFKIDRALNFLKNGLLDKSFILKL